MNFIALVCQTVIDTFRTNAKWNMKLDKDDKTWNPFVSINKIDIFFADYIRDDFFESTQEYPLFEAYETVLAIAKFQGAK